MCQNCGCNAMNNIVDVNSLTQKIEINQRILTKNDRLALQNRHFFKSQGLLVINLLSSPGSGKTALIERMQIEIEQGLQEYSDRFKIGVIVGDLATDNDAQRLQSRKIPAVQITTGNACHLEANMVRKAAQKLDLDSFNLLIIENVGNLVCPAAYDLGEDLRIVLLSVTEGEDKPLKYPTMFKSAQIVIINKIDLAEAVDFERDKAIANIPKIAPQAQIFEVSAKTGQGIKSLLTYLNCCKISSPSITSSSSS
ncbi:MAG: hydrogenase nickel incorporation protein HypB [Pleurocapsa sp. SU_5_0]|nr:hydrogenase nickel incorporation protein HypB [Pleurocapsa sp. SU_5_0]NJO96366.1 hydrogenase nickel incorporation protein HypB [Pleurocapsa sp. CRU_1_2]NJR47450.1 hydrogenase nickel incorporation protein HypB [Hyellaceae cyanobacterium CSU_1_1]